MKKYIKGFYDYRFLLSELVKRGIRLKYRRSYLGIVWSLIEPLMTTAVLVVVFGALFDRANDPTFATYIMAGRLVYTFFQNGTKGASKAIRGNAGMIKKIYVPKYLYPLSNVLFNFIIFLISLIVLVPVLIISRLTPSLRLWKLIPGIILLLILTIGVGMILSVLDVFFRDIEYLWNVLLMIIMYLSAIFYPIERIKKHHLMWLLHLNPLYCIINLFRGGLMKYGNPLWEYAYPFVFGVICFIVGFIAMKKKQDEFILHL
ncbi:MAG: ABC transporter permease [Lachnospiraceae bacterium]|uniref:Transport permease protein n=1 Tax=Candidatus Weimeria bifida TaxID=2599074 RepID=A0A6N7IZW4_9FIRM|nr:ABC transporter permease [Candidatus Weimeria bifida]RRF96444.1 MAG: ABC transporter permease [Lachnospiraceae bacterium]